MDLSFYGVLGKIGFLVVWVKKVYVEFGYL